MFSGKRYVVEPVGPVALVGIDVEPAAGAGPVTARLLDEDDGLAAEEEVVGVFRVEAERLG